MIWFKFALCLVIILFAGIKLARYGDAIAEKTGLGRVWIGLVLLAAITSMPELVTGVSSVALVKPPEPDLAMGTLLGSCSLNLAILDQNFASQAIFQDLNMRGAHTAT